MAKASMTVRVEERTRKTLDKIAATMDRDRSYVVNEAIDSYIELHQWQVKRIKEGLRQARAGEFVPQAEVDQFFERVLGKKK